VLSFEDNTLLVPEAVVLDSSFVVRALLPNEPLHHRCRDYLARLADGGTTIFFNRLLELELAETAVKLALIERYGRERWRTARLDGRARRRSSRLLEATLGAWQAALDAFDHGRVEVEVVVSDATALMELGLGSYDAVHAATAIHTGCRTIVATDVGFGVVPETELLIYTDARRVRDTRDRRPR
jgi:predicted nucleic acid-binding protein